MNDNTKVFYQYDGNVSKLFKFTNLSCYGSRPILIYSNYSHIANQLIDDWQNKTTLSNLSSYYTSIQYYQYQINDWQTMIVIT